MSAANAVFSTQKKTGLDNAKHGARSIRVAVSKSPNTQCVRMKNPMTRRALDKEQTITSSTEICVAATMRVFGPKGTVT